MTVSKSQNSKPYEGTPYENKQQTVVLTALFAILTLAPVGLALADEHPRFGFVVWMIVGIGFGVIGTLILVQPRISRE